MKTPERTSREASLLSRPVEALVSLLKRNEPRALPTESLDERTLAEVCELLSEKRRQYVLRSLDSMNGPEYHFGELVDRVAELENECDRNEVTPEQRNRVFIALYQSHLPRFAKADVLSFDQEQNIVSEGPQFTQVWTAYETLIDALSER